MTAPICTLDGFGPLPLLRPGSVQEIGEMVRQAAAANQAVYPLGGQTHAGLGNVPTRPGQAIDLRGLAQIIDFPARDMTVTVQAGISVQALQDILAREKLRLPIDVARADQATLGGIIAANVSGPRRYGYGTLRDYVIGISAVNDEGAEFKAGGRVVKNVAGYDLCKLLVGSLGTLGIITQATLKLRPVPEERAVVWLQCEVDQLSALLTSLHGSRTRPVCIEALNRPAAQAVFTQAGLGVPEGPWVILVGYEGNFDAVGWEVQQLVKEVAAQYRLDARVNFPATPLCHALCEWGAGPETAVAFKATMPPSATAAFCRDVDLESNRPALRAHAGNGIVHGVWPGDLTNERAASILTEWRELTREGQGGVIVTRCPSAWKQTLNVWGPPPADAWLMREIKAPFDPRGIFNPGRFVDGI
jgi:glycolate oxidase FAD binding subunit